MSCQGKPIEMADLRTPEQKEMMSQLLPIMLGGMQQGATPFGGQLSAPPDQGMLNAMNMMSHVGGQGPYQWGGMQTGPYGAPGGGVNTGQTGGFAGGGGGPADGSSPFDPEWWIDKDPYAPGKRDPNDQGPPNRPPFEPV